MRQYVVSIFDISDIEKKKFLDEVLITAADKGDAQDKAHTVAFKKYPRKKRMVSIRSV